MIRVGIINANINNSKYLSIIDGGSDDVGDDDCDVDAVVILAKLWILDPKVNDDRSFFTCIESDIAFLKLTISFKLA